MAAPIVGLCQAKSRVMGSRRGVSGGSAAARLRSLTASSGGLRLRAAESAPDSTALATRRAAASSRALHSTPSTSSAEEASHASRCSGLLSSAATRSSDSRPTEIVMGLTHDGSRNPERQVLHTVSSSVCSPARGARLAEPLHTLSSTVPLPPAVHDAASADVSRRLRSVQRALHRLGAEESLGRLVNLAPRFACQALELDRAMLLHISGNNIVSGTAWAAGDLVAAADFARFLRAAHPQLTSCPPEFEAVQRRLPILVTNAQRRDDVYRPLVHAARSDAYVVAPMIRGDRVIGLLHADRYPVVDRHLDVLDRDLLWTFATGLADLIDRAAARGLQGSAWRQDAEPADEAPAAAAVGPSAVSPSSGPLTLLTSREHEVLALLAEGASNATIASRLVISEATVKSHVRHILRKLRAANRTEAVIRYQTLVAGVAAVASS